MANGASRGGDKSKPKGFKKQGQQHWPTVQVKPGEFRKQQLDNIKQLSAESMGSRSGAPGKKGGTSLNKVVTRKPDRGQAQVDNLRQWGSGKVKPGDNPYGGGHSGTKGYRD